jgi:hypothetical protein
MIFPAALMCMAGCASAPKIEEPGPVQHVIVCWLKEQGNIEAREYIIQACKTLERIPGVLAVSVGGVLPSQRSMVDSSFDVALVITLSDIDILPTYITHPVHQRVLNEVVKPLAEKVLVYDFVENHASIR